MLQEAIINTEERSSLSQHVLDSEDAKALIVREGARLCAACAGAAARAVVLSGSMSRGEATLKQDGTGWRALGDATFVVLFDGPAKLNVMEVQRDIEGALLRKGITCKIAVVVASTDELRHMKPHIYAYELRERGVVLWGDKDALGLMPSFTGADIPQEDGWWFLCNRMIEQLESAAKADSMDDNAVRYRIAKLYLAMTACYLLAIGQYLPSYRERAARLKALAQQHYPAAPIDLERFATLVEQCTNLKLYGEIDPDDAGNFPGWRDAVVDTEAVWRWTLARITDLSPDHSRQHLLRAMAKRQSVQARAKAWARAAYVSRSEFSRNCFRWAKAAFSNSPRYLVYRAASELFFSTVPKTLTPDQIAAIAQLPLTSSEADQISWRDAVILVAHNFHMFVESTRC